MLFTQKCNYVCRHLSNRPVCYVKFCVYVYELMRIFMFSLLTFTIYSFQTYFIRYLWLLGRQIGIFFRHTCICLKNQREEITWLCRCMCTISCYLISCAANLLNSAWVWRAFEWPERCDIGETLTPVHHFSEDLFSLWDQVRLPTPEILLQHWPGWNKSSSMQQHCALSWAVLWAVLLLGYVIRICHKESLEYNGKGVDQVCVFMGITLHSSWDLDGSSVDQKVDAIPIGCHNITRRTGGLIVDASQSKHYKHWWRREWCTWCIH